MGGCGDSNRYSGAATALGCLVGALTGRSNNQVLPTSRTAAVIQESLEANLGTTLHALTGSASSRLRAAMAAITRPANHGPGSSAFEAAPARSSRVTNRSCAASRQ